MCFIEQVQCENNTDLLLFSCYLKCGHFFNWVTTNMLAWLHFFSDYFWVVNFSLTLLTARSLPMLFGSLLWTELCYYKNSYFKVLYPLVFLERIALEDISLVLKGL